MPITKEQARSEQLLLNTTHEERKFITSLLDRSRASTNSDLMREAFQHYLSFHDRVRNGEEIIVRSAGGRSQRSIFIPLEWKDSTYRGIEEGESEAETKEAPARKVMEIRLDQELKARLQQFVTNGFAPSLTALAGASLQIYASVLDAQHEGSEVRAKLKDGSEVVLVEPKRETTSPKHDTSNSTE